jgi:hypothetical protein
MSAQQWVQEKRGNSWWEQAMGEESAATTGATWSGVAAGQQQVQVGAEELARSQCTVECRSPGAGVSAGSQRRSRRRGQHHRPLAALRGGNSDGVERRRGWASRLSERYTETLVPA